MKNNTVTFEIKAQLGKLNTNESGWSKELNLVVWNESDVKYDIRDWDPTHTKMSRGITLTATEAENLYKLLKRMYERR